MPSVVMMFSIYIFTEYPVAVARQLLRKLKDPSTN
jgi:hypothetical protein